MGIRLSVAAVDRLKATGKRREIADAGKPGLYLVIQPSGRKSWAVRYRMKGESRKLTLDGFPSLDVARKLAQEALDKVAQGKDPGEEKQAARKASGYIIEDVLAEFMVRHIKRRDGRPIRESTKQETARLLGLKLDGDRWIPRTPKSGVLARWAGRDVRTITKRDVNDIIDDRAETAPVGANRTLAALKTVFSWCVKRDIIALSPCDHIDAPSAEKSVERALSDDEIAALWRAADSMGYPYGRMIQMLLLTGQRRDEVRKATWHEFDQHRWTIPAARTKNGKRDHLVLLDKTSMKLLEALPRIKSKHQWLFSIAGDVPVSNLARRKRRIDQAMLAELRKGNPSATLTPWRVHDMRHTLKTWMQKARITKDVRNAVQNHFDGDMDELYGHHTFEDEKRDALDRWARHVESLISGTTGMLRAAQ